MFGKFVLLLICVAALGAVLIWRGFDPFNSSRYATVRDTSPEPVPPPVKAVPAKKTAAVPKVEPPISPKVLQAVLAETAPRTPSPQGPAVEPVDPPPFPRVDQIIPGSAEDAVIDKYGAPAISTLTSRGGHIVGTYVYAKDQGRSETVIHLQDGKVASVYSRSAPPTPTGMPAPRRWQNE